MKELDDLLNDLKNHLLTKELELKNNPNFNSYTESFLENRRRDIESFQYACKNCDTNSVYQKEIIANFRIDADKIKLEIDKITC